MQKCKFMQLIFRPYVKSYIMMKVFPTLTNPSVIPYIFINADQRLVTFREMQRGYTKDIARSSGIQLNYQYFCKYRRKYRYLVSV